MAVDVGSLVGSVYVFVEASTVVNKRIFKCKINFIISILRQITSILKLYPMIFKLNLPILFYQLSVDGETTDLTSVEIEEKVFGVFADMKVYFYVTAIEILVLRHSNL